MLYNILVVVYMNPILLKSYPTLNFLYRRY